MTGTWIHLGVMLILILIAAEVFTNAIEHFGHKIGFSAGVVGSVFAAVATALPETSIPIIAMVSGSANRTTNEEISVGAILGAPIMLSTIAIVLMAFFTLKNRGIHGRVIPEPVGFKRDMNYFLAAFSLAAVAMYIPLTPYWPRAIFSVILVNIYVVYLIRTFTASKQLVSDGHGVVPDQPLLISRLGFKDSHFITNMQLLFALILLLVGAKGFINDVEHISQTLKLSALLLSLLIIPIATELPEKVNSILWIRKNKDTLAFGNITGAMVFQGSLLPALGILLTPWQPSKEVLPGMVITLLAALWLRFNASPNGLSLKSLMVNGMLYVIYLSLAMLTIYS